MTPPDVNQVVTAATGFGYAARCGCGWRAVRETKIGAIAAGQRHLHEKHGGPVPERVAPEGDVA